MGWLTPFLDLVVGVSCALCRSPGEALCRSCARRLAGEVPHHAWREGLDVPLVAAHPYRPHLARLIPAFKDDGALHLAVTLGGRLAVAVAALAVRPPFVLVPVPSSAEARRSRGLDHGMTLARVAATHLGVRARPCVRRRGGSRRHQRDLSRAQRMAILQGMMRTTPRVPVGVPVIVTDDVVTTGSSLVATIRALQGAGCLVVGAATIADADRRTVRCVEVPAAGRGGE